MGSPAENVLICFVAQKEAPLRAKINPHLLSINIFSNQRLSQMAKFSPALVVKGRIAALPSSPPQQYVWRKRRRSVGGVYNRVTASELPKFRHALEGSKESFTRSLLSSNVCHFAALIWQSLSKTTFWCSPDATRQVQIGRVQMLLHVPTHLEDTK